MNKKIIIVLVLAGLIAALVWYASRPKPVEIVVAEIERGEVRATVANTRAGTVKACSRARLAPAMGGQIAELPVREGDRVTADQILLELWNDDLEAELTFAEREAVAAQARAEEVCVSARVARREADRLTKLEERGLTSEDLAEKARGDAESREAGCRAGKQSTRVSAARIDSARAALERTILRAPFDGTVAEINGEVGEFVTPSPVGIPTPPAVDLIDSSCLYISAPIDEVDAPQIRAGMPARVSLDAFPDRFFNATVRRVAPYVLDVEKQARTVEIEAEIDQTEITNLLPGYSADVEVILAVQEDVVRIPTQAILEGARVLVFERDTRLIQEREIDTGIGNWSQTEVVSGLEVGELVVTSIDREGVEDGALATPE